MSRDTTGIEKRPWGYRAVVSRGSRGATPLRRDFPLSTPLHEIQQWRRDEQARTRLERKQLKSSGLFQRDAAAYLRQPEVVAMPSFEDRKREIGVWVAVFGQSDRGAITPDMIRHWRDTWKVDPRPGGTRPLAPATINRRLRALSSLYRVLDAGKGCYNPVSDVDELKTPQSRPKDIPADALPALLAAMDTRGRAERGQDRPKDSKSRARVGVLLTTGLPAGTLMKLRPADVDFKRKTMTLPERLKGDGSPPVVLPLSDKALAAFRELSRVDAWGKFSNSSLGKSLKIAAQKTLGHDVTPYALRHTFATQVARASGDEVAVMTLLQHRSIATTRKYYTLGSHFDRAKAALRGNGGETTNTASRKKPKSRGANAKPSAHKKTAHSPANSQRTGRKSNK